MVGQPIVVGILCTGQRGFDQLFLVDQAVAVRITQAILEVIVEGGHPCGVHQGAILEERRETVTIHVRGR